MEISISKETERFADFLKQKDNENIIFSGAFGIGKSYFLNNFFNQHKDKYTGIYLTPLKCKNMAEDIKENAMSGGTPARLRGLDANGNSISPTLEEVMNAMGLFYKRFTVPAGGQYELPFNSGLIIVQDLSQNYDKSVAILWADGRGKVIVPADTISFFSDVEDKICVINTGANTKYIIKNSKAKERVVIVTFIK